MVQPREQQLGSITILDEDGSGTVNASNANIINLSGLVGIPVSSEPDNNSIWIEDVSPTLLKYTDSDGYTITLGAGGGGGSITQINETTNEVITITNGSGPTVSINVPYINFDSVANKILLGANGPSVGDVGNGTITVGPVSNGSGLHNIGIGNVDLNTGGYNFVSGYESQATSDYGVSIGYQSNAAYGAVAIGRIAFGASAYAVTIGSGAQSNDAFSVALGSDAVASGVSGVVVGKSAATGTAPGNIAIGLSSSASSSTEPGIAIGSSAVAGLIDGIAIGNNAFGGMVTGGIAIGNDANAGQNYGSIAIGESASAGDSSGIVIGQSAAMNSGNLNIGIGNFVILGTDGITNIALGAYAAIGNSVERSIAIGNNAEISSGGTDIVSIGYNAESLSGTNSVIIGPNAKSNGDYNISIGSASGISGTGTLNIMVGFGAVGYGTSDSSQINIGNHFVVDGTYQNNYHNGKTTIGSASSHAAQLETFGIYGQSDDLDQTPMFGMHSNVTDIKFFMGIQNPNTAVSGNPGDIYFQSNLGSSAIYQNLGSTPNNTTWSAIGGGGGGSQDLESVLNQGNTSEGYDIILNDGSDLTLDNGIISWVSGPSNGYNANIVGSNASAINGIGGSITLTPGTGNGTGAGGLFSIVGGTAGATGTGGAISIISGEGGSTSGSSGSITLNTGTTTSGAAGEISLEVGNRGNTGFGSHITMKAGNGNTTGSGGNVVIRSGSAGVTSGDGGIVHVFPGSSSGGGNDGYMWVSNLNLNPTGTIRLGNGGYLSGSNNGTTISGPGDFQINFTAGTISIGTSANLLTLPTTSLVAGQLLSAGRISGTNLTWSNPGAYLLTNTQTGTSYAAQASDLGKLVTLSNAAAISVTVPGNIGLVAGDVINFMQLGAGQVTFSGTSGMTLSGRGGFLKSNGQYSVSQLIVTSSTTGIITDAARSDGLIYQDTGVPAAVTDASVIRKRAVDGALITRLVANQYTAFLNAVVDTSSTSTTQIAELHLENSTTFDVSVIIKARNSTVTQRCSLTYRILGSVNGSGTVSITESTLTYPDAMPAASPGAWVTYASVVTSSVAASNKLRLSVTAGNTNNIRWSATLNADVTEG